MKKDICPIKNMCDHPVKKSGVTRNSLSKLLTKPIGQGQCVGGLVYANDYSGRYAHTNLNKDQQSR